MGTLGLLAASSTTGTKRLQVLTVLTATLVAAMLWNRQEKKKKKKEEEEEEEEKKKEKKNEATNDLVSKAKKVEQKRGRLDSEVSAGELDPSEELQRVFVAAQEFASNGLGKVDNETKLKLYSFFKQATVGKCNTSKPSMLEFVASAKWNAWNELGDMSSDDAKQGYINVVESIAPGWNEMDESKLVEVIQSLQESAPKNNNGGGTGGSSMAPSVSTMVMGEDDIAFEDQTPVEKLFTFASDGKVNELIDALKSQRLDVDSIRGEDEETLLHMACDRGDLEMIKRLVELGADVESVDVDGLTPLAYSLVNDNEEACVLLIKDYRANLNAKGNDGETFGSLCSKSLLEKLQVIA